MAAAKGNDYARKWTEDEAIEVFIEGLNFADDDDDALCIEDVFKHMEMPKTTFYDLIKQFDVLNSIKGDMNSAIVRRVNAAALKSGFAAAPAIWRLKQMGESDQQNINVTSNGKSLPDWMDEK